MIKNIVIFFALSLLCISHTATAFSAQDKDSKVIYLDMSFYNDQHRSPAIDKDKFEKLLTRIATSLKGQLNKQGNAIIYITGTPGGYKDFDDTLNDLDEAQKKHVELYVSLTANVTDKDCVRIQYPKFEKKSYKKSEKTDKAIPQDMFEAIGNWDRESLTNETRTLANLMLQDIRKNAPKICCAVNAGSNYLLDIARFPTLNIEFQLQNIDNPPLYLREDAINKTTYAISNAISNFLSYPVGSPMRTGVKEKK